MGQGVDGLRGRPAAGDPDWDEWESPLRTRTTGSSAADVPIVPMLHLDGFDGPMDLLLDLAERQRIDFGRMSVRALAEQFVAAFEQLADRVAIERHADWLVMATRLVLLRSRLLCPESPVAADAAQRDAAAELRRIDDLAKGAGCRGLAQCPARPWSGRVCPRRAGPSWSLSRGRRRGRCHRLPLGEPRLNRGRRWGPRYRRPLSPHLDGPLLGRRGP